jgi:hypothetical protein
MTKAIAIRVLPLAAGVFTSACIFDPGEPHCTPNPSPQFTFMFTDLSLVRSIVPLGTPSTGGEIKERHQVQLLSTTDANGVSSGMNAPVIAPAPARLQATRHFQSTSPPFAYADEYYGFVLEFSCEVTARFDHIRSPGEKLRKAAGEAFASRFFDPEDRIAIAAGEVLGHTDGTPPGTTRSFAWDYAVYNTTHENTFANMSRYRETHLGNNLHSVCGGSYYSGSLRAAFDAALGYAGNTAAGNCRGASRDVPGALAGGWFRVGAAEESTGWRLGIATEFDGFIRLAIHPFGGDGFGPIRTSGRVNLDPALATGTVPYCYTSGSSEYWFKLSADGQRMSMLQRAGNCTGAEPTSYAVEWER